MLNEIVDIIHIGVLFAAFLATCFVTLGIAAKIIDIATGDRR